MRVYSEKLINKFKSIIAEQGLVGDEKRKDFAEKQVLPFLFNLMDEIVASDGLEALDRRIFNDEGAGMAIITENGKSYFAIEKNHFLSRWVEHNRLNGMPKRMKDRYLIKEIECAFHEERHHVQHKFISEKDFFKTSPYSLVYLKEDLIIRSDEKWYRQNHGNFWSEIEAHLAAYNGCSDFVSKAMPNSEFAKEYALNANSNIDILVKPDEYLKGTSPKSYIISKKFDELVENTAMSSPNVLKQLFEEYPILTMIYREDGSKKNIKEVLDARKEMINTNRSSLQNIIEVDGLKTNVASHINRTFDIIIASDKELSEEYGKYQEMKKEGNVI